MNIVQTINIEVVRNSRYYNYTIPVGAPFEEAEEVCRAILDQIIVNAKKVAEGEKAKQEPANEASSL